MLHLSDNLSDIIIYKKDLLRFSLLCIDELVQLLRFEKNSENKLTSVLLTISTDLYP